MGGRDIGTLNVEWLSDGKRRSAALLTEEDDRGSEEEESQKECGGREEWRRTGEEIKGRNVVEEEEKSTMAMSQKWESGEAEKMETMKGGHWKIKGSQQL